MTEMIPAQVHQDIEDIGKAVNTDAIITPRYGAPFKSLPMIAREIYADVLDLRTNKADKIDVDAALSTKAPQATTYTKLEVDSALSAKAPQSNTYTKAEVDTTFAAYVGGRKAYTTLALAQAAQASLPANTAIEVTNDGANNGTYQWNGTTLTKSDYDPLTQAKTYTNKYTTGREVEFLKPSEILGAAIIPASPTSQFEVLGNHVNFTDGFYIGAGGALFPFASTRISDYIKISPNDSFTITPSLTYIGAVYDKYLQFLGMLSGTEGGTATVTITQANAAFVRFNISIPDVTRVYANIKKTTLPWLNTTPDNIADALEQIINSGANENILSGASFTDGGYIDNTNTVAAWPPYKYTSGFIPIEPSSRYVISFAALHVGVFFDENKNFIGSIPGTTGDGVYNYEFTTPASARYVKINISKQDDPIQTVRLKGYGLGLKTKSGWDNKKIAWYGTSIPAGYPYSNTDAERDVFSHANLAVHDLGGEIINKCVPAGGVGLGVNLSFVRTTDAINYQNSLLNLIGTANEPDLVVFDYGVNDYDQDPADIDAFDPNDPFDSGNTGTKTKLDTRDTSTFIGAYNTIIDAMLTAKPDMKFCFITHFSFDNASPNIAVKKDNWKKLIQCQQALADYWSAPILNLHEKTGYRNRNGFNSITPAMPDHIHPASGNGESVESLRNIVRDFLVSIG